MSLKTKTFSLWIKCYIYNNEYILYLKRNVRNSFICNTILLISIPYLIIRWCGIYIYEQIIGKYLIDKKIKAENDIEFPHEIALVTISKNEGPYIKEWIEYHKQVGITKIYFYDNESEDNTLSILTPYITSGLVEYIKIKGKAQQLEAYNHAIYHYKNQSRYMAFIDMDEFIMPQEPFKPINTIINELLRKAPLGAVGIGVNWALYGSSFLVQKPHGLIIENFIHRGRNNHWINFHIKTICNPRFVKKYISPHYPLYKIGAYSISEATGKKIYGWFCHSVEYKHLRINHYFTKSKEQYIQKRNRGLGDRLGLYDLEMFTTYDLNDIKDQSMDIYSKAIKEVLNI